MTARNAPLRIAILLALLVGCHRPRSWLDGSIDGAEVGRSMEDVHSFWIQPMLDPDPASQPVGALFQMPSDAPEAGVWFCAAQVSTQHDASEDTTEITSISRLGACPGQAVSGGVTFTFCGTGAACGDPRVISFNSTITGSTFDQSSLGDVTPLVGLVFDDAHTELDVDLVPPGVRGFATFAHVVLDIDDPSGDPGISDGTIVDGLYLVGHGLPDARGVYCIGGGHMVQGPSELAFTHLTRLGACGETPVAGALRIRRAL